MIPTIIIAVVAAAGLWLFYKTIMQMKEREKEKAELLENSLALHKGFIEFFGLENQWATYLKYLSKKNELENEQ